LAPVAGAVDTGRIWRRLEELYAIGERQGANRPHGSPAEDEAHRLAARWMRDAGLEVEVDASGNLFGHVQSGRVQGSDPQTWPVWTGSHLDTVPQGGRFDGALGVVAGLEAVERAGAGTVAVFRGEEVGCIGSRALVARGGPFPRAFLELHIEQGPVLEQAGVPVAVATGIVGYKRGELVFEGRAGHAGTTPMDARDDALTRAAEAILRIRDAARAIEGAVATVGRLEVEPGGVNVIPGRVRMTVDVRAPDRQRLDELVAAVGIQSANLVEPVAMSLACIAVLRAELEARDLPVVELVSGAGHDAGVLAAAGVDAGMLLVRSLNGGVSHCPDELSSEEDVRLAVEVLVGALRRLAAA
jgi:acetylornithine deacetylase/succinyl-diaminopimelate desuccinylase-like protein